MLALLRNIHRRAELLEHSLQILKARYESLMLPEDEELLRAIQAWKETKDPDYIYTTRVTINPYTKGMG